MHTLQQKTFLLALGFVLFFQMLAGLWHIGDPFTDGRYHYNWAPPFWLMHAERINDVGLLNTYGGLEGYSSHPQLIGPVIALWTSVFGYEEGSFRFLALLCTALATMVLTLFVWNLWGEKRALLFALFFAALPIIYIYGKMPNQEMLVLLFLALTLLGSTYVGENRPLSLGVIGVGALGMMLSDWSGITLALALIFAVFWMPGWEEKKEKMYVVGALVAGTVLGLALFLTQSYLQGDSVTVGAFFQNYLGLWQYRAGATTEGFSLVQWGINQGVFFGKNFTFLFGVLAIFGVGLWFRSRRVEEVGSRQLAVLAAAVAGGTLLYLVLVPHASGVHLFFQYYLALPIALGLVYAVETVAHLFSRSPERLFIGFAVFVFVVLAMITGVRYHTFMTANMWGTKEDMKLLESLQDIPEQYSIVASERDSLHVSWFGHPNSRYYSGREIVAYELEKGVPLAEYQVVPKLYVESIVEQINQGVVYGNGFSAREERCATTYCLIRITGGELQP